MKSLLKQIVFYFNFLFFYLGENFYFIKLELDRALVKANKSDLLATKKMEGVESVVKSFEKLSALSSKVDLLLKSFDNSTVIKASTTGGLSDMMSMWK